MNQTNPTPVKQCEFCEKVLHGRSDQRFCNDTCRNTFNRNLRMAEKAEHHKNIPEIIRIIKKNYEILKPIVRNICFVGDYITYDSVEEFMRLGINTKFFTSIHTDDYDCTWHCVFECGYRIVDTKVLVGIFSEQAKI